MPLCHLAIRTLHRTRNTVILTISTRLCGLLPYGVRRTYSAALEDICRDEAKLSALVKTSEAFVDSDRLGLLPVFQDSQPRDATSAAPIRGLKEEDGRGDDETHEPVAPRKPQASPRRMRCLTSRYTPAVHHGSQKLASRRLFQRLSRAPRMPRMPRISLMEWTWEREFYKLYKYHCRRYENYYKKEVEPLVLYRPMMDYVQRISAHLDKQKSQSAQSIPMLDLKINQDIWIAFILWCLHHDPEKALDFLAVTHHMRLTAAFRIIQVVRYLAIHFGNTENQSQLQRLADLYPVLSRLGDTERLWFGWTFIRRVFEYCDKDQLRNLYQDLKINFRTYLGWGIWLRLAAQLAKRHNCDQALDAILEAKEAGAKVGSWPFCTVCATLLRRAADQPGELRACIEIVERLLKLGLILNNSLINIMMLNAVDSGDVKTAISIYRSLEDYGLQPDQYTYAILLKGCKTVIDDAELLNEVIRNAISHINVLQAPVVAAEILHCLALHHTKHHPRNAWEIIVDAFVQLYDPRVLHQLGVSTAKTQKAPNVGDRRPPSSPQALHIFLVLHLERLFVNSQSTAPVYELYLRVRRLMEACEEPFASMAETDYLFNAFLGAFIRTKKGLLYAAQLVKDMQRPDDTNPAKYKQCKPTVQTWSIFLHGFVRHGQMQLAHQVEIYMRGKGILPNLVTYNTLLGGYAGLQNLEGIQEITRRMVADGYTWDDWSVGNANRFNNQGKMLAALQNKSHEAPLDFVQDLKENLEARLVRAKPLPEALEAPEEVRSEVSSR